MATTKRDLVERVSAKHSGMTKLEAGQVVQTFLDKFTDAVAQGERIELRGFGVFAPRERAARRARNPKTGVSINVPASRTVAFKAGKELKAKLGPPVTGGGSPTASPPSGLHGAGPPSNTASGSR
jgi:integration host factor subunit beta